MSDFDPSQNNAAGMMFNLNNLTPQQLAMLRQQHQHQQQQQQQQQQLLQQHRQQQQQQLSGQAMGQQAQLQRNPFQQQQQPGGFPVGFNQQQLQALLAQQQAQNGGGAQQQQNAAAAVHAFRPPQQMQQHQQQGQQQQQQQGQQQPLMAGMPTLAQISLAIEQAKKGLLNPEQLNALRQTIARQQQIQQAQQQGVRPPQPQQQQQQQAQPPPQQQQQQQQQQTPFNFAASGQNFPGGQPRTPQMQASAQMMTGLQQVRPAGLPMSAPNYLQPGNQQPQQQQNLGQGQEQQKQQQQQMARAQTTPQQPGAFGQSAPRPLQPPQSQQQQQQQQQQGAAMMQNPQQGQQQATPRPPAGTGDINAEGRNPIHFLRMLHQRIMDMETKLASDLSQDERKLLQTQVANVKRVQSAIFAKLNTQNPQLAAVAMQQLQQMAQPPQPSPANSQNPQNGNGAGTMMAPQTQPSPVVRPPTRPGSSGVAQVRPPTQQPGQFGSPMANPSILQGQNNGQSMLQHQPSQAQIATPQLQQQPQQSPHVRPSPQLAGPSAGANGGPQVPVQGVPLLRPEQFMRALLDLMKKRGTPITALPKVGNRDLDLYRFYQIVQAHGGSEAAHQKGAWPAIAIALELAPLGSPQTQSLGQVLAAEYRTYLAPFEETWQRAMHHQYQMSMANAGLAAQAHGAGPSNQNDPTKAAAAGQMPMQQQQQQVRPPTAPQQMHQMQQQQQQQQQGAGHVPSPMLQQAQQIQQQQLGQGQAVRPPQSASLAGFVPQPAPVLSQENLARMGMTQDQFAKMFLSNQFNNWRALNMPQQQQQQTPQPNGQVGQSSPFAPHQNVASQGPVQPLAAGQPLQQQQQQQQHQHQQQPPQTPQPWQMQQQPRPPQMLPPQQPHHQHQVASAVQPGGQIPTQMSFGTPQMQMGAPMPNQQTQQQQQRPGPAGAFQSQQQAPGIPHSQPQPPQQGGAAPTAAQVAQAQPPPLQQQQGPRQQPLAATRFIAVSPEQLEQARIAMQRIDQELATQRPQLPVINNITEDERDQILDQVRKLAPIQATVTALLPAFYAMNGNLEPAKRLKIMAFMYKDQYDLLAKKQCILRLADLDKLKMQMSRCISFVRSSNPQIAHSIIQQVGVHARSLSQPGSTPQGSQGQQSQQQMSPSQAQAQLQFQQQQQQQQALHLQQPGAPLQPPLQQRQQQQPLPPAPQQQQPLQQGQASPATSNRQMSVQPGDAAARAAPTDAGPGPAAGQGTDGNFDAAAAMHGIKRGLRVENLKLPPNKRAKSGASAAKGSGASPPNGAAANDSPKLAPGSPQQPKDASTPAASTPVSGKGGKKVEKTAKATKGSTKKGKGAASNASGPEPDKKFKTSADIMAEVKREMAEAERRKREGEAASGGAIQAPEAKSLQQQQQPTAGAGAPSEASLAQKAELEAIERRKREIEMAGRDPAGFVEAAWQDLLASSRPVVNGPAATGGSDPAALRSGPQGAPGDASGPSSSVAAATAAAQGHDSKALQSLLSLLGQQDSLPLSMDGSMPSNVFGSADAGKRSMLDGQQPASSFPESSIVADGLHSMADPDAALDIDFFDFIDASAAGPDAFKDETQSELATILGADAAAAAVAGAATNESDPPAETPELVASSRLYGGVGSGSSTSSNSTASSLRGKLPGTIANSKLDFGSAGPSSTSPAELSSSDEFDWEHNLQSPFVRRTRLDRLGFSTTSEVASAAAAAAASAAADDGNNDKAAIGQVELGPGQPLGGSNEQIDTGIDWWDVDHFASGCNGNAASDQPWAILS